MLPKRAAVTVWRGRGVMAMAVPIVLQVLDGAGNQTEGPVQPDRQVLTNMWRPDDPEDEPPVVKVQCIGDAIPYQQLDWIISNLEWGDTNADADMNRITQAFTLTLTEYRPDERIQNQAKISAALKRQQAAKKKAKTKSRGDKFYIVKKGDTLTSIAQRKNIDGGWRAIGDIQKPKITDPKAVKVGQKLRLP